MLLSLLKNKAQKGLVFFLKFSSFYVFSYFFLSCNTERDQILQNKVNSIPLAIENLEGIRFSNYSIFKDSIIYYDDFSKSLFKKSLINFLSDSEKIELIDNFSPIKLNYISADSILFYDGANLLLYLNSGAEQKKFSLFEGLDHIAQEVYAEYPYEKIANSLIYYPDRKSVLFYFAKVESSKKRIFAEYSLKTKTWNSLPVFHPVEFDDVALNYTTFPSVAAVEGGFSFIYSISPTLVEFSFERNSQMETKITSFPGKQSAEPQTDRDSWDQNYFQNWVMNSPNYLKLLYDPYRKVYYRIAQEALEKEVPIEEDYYSILLRDRQLFLTVLDVKFQVLKNYPLEKGRYDPSHSFVFSQGLWIPYAEEFVEKENLLEGDLIEFID